MGGIIRQREHGQITDAYIHGGSIVGNLNIEILESGRENIWHSLVIKVLASKNLMLND